MLGARDPQVGWTPREMARVVAWWDFGDPNTMRFDTGVSFLRDKSRNGLHGSQATGSAQPTLVRNGIHHPTAIRCTASASQYFGLIRTLDLTGVGYTVIARVSRSGPAGSNAIHLLGKSGASNFAFRLHTDNRLYATSTSKYWASDVTVGTGVRILTIIARPDDTFTVRNNGVVAAGAVSSGLGGLTYDRLFFGFSTEYANGDTYEAIVCAGEPPMRDIMRAEAFLGRLAIP